jgi:hypothetical protein
MLRFQSYYAVSALRLIAHHATFVAIWAIGIVLAASVADAAQLTLGWVTSQTVLPPFASSGRPAPPGCVARSPSNRRDSPRT